MPVALNHISRVLNLSTHVLLKSAGVLNKSTDELLKSASVLNKSTDELLKSACELDESTDKLVITPNPSGFNLAKTMVQDNLR
jgi:hypothetical protein